MRLLLSLFLISTIIGCTEKKPQQTAVNQSPNLTRDGRGLATTSKSKKKYQFSLTSEQLKKITPTVQYYYMKKFADAIPEFQRLLRSGRYGSFDNKVLNILIPKADATICPTGGWLLDFGEMGKDFSACTRKGPLNDERGVLGPEDSPDYERYKPVGALGEKPCPAGEKPCISLGLKISGNQVSVQCAKAEDEDYMNGKSACEKKYYDEKGLENTVDLLTECSYLGSLQSVTNIKCDELEESVTRAFAMFSDVCIKVGPQFQAVQKKCEELQNLTRQLNDMLARRVVLPTSESCKSLLEYPSNEQDAQKCNHLFVQDAFAAIDQIIGNPIGGEKATVFDVTSGECKKFPVEESIPGKGTTKRYELTNNEKLLTLHCPAIVFDGIQEIKGGNGGNKESTW